MTEKRDADFFLFLVLIFSLLSQAKIVFVGAFENYLLCTPEGPGNTTRRLLNEGRIAFVLLETLFNRSCTPSEMATYCADQGATGVVFILDRDIQLAASLWSTNYGRNTTAIPALFSRDYFAFDILQFEPDELATFDRVFGITNGNVTMVSVQSKWAQIASTFGYVFQIVMATFAGINIYLAAKSLIITFR